MAKKLFTALVVLFLFTVTCHADISNDMYYRTEGNTITYGGSLSGLDGISDTDYSLIINFFDGDKMLYADSFTVNKSLSEFSMEEKSITLSKSPSSTITSKIMLWDNLNSCKPLTNFYDNNKVNTYYGVIDRVSYSTNEDAYVARIIKTDGTRESFVIKQYNVIAGSSSSVAFDLYNAVYAGIDISSNNEIEFADSTTLESAENRVISYRLDGRNAIYNIQFLETITVADATFNQNTSKIGDYNIASDTSIINATEIGEDNLDTGTYTTSDISAITVDSLIDNQMYSVIMAKPYSSDLYDFVIVMAGTIL